MTKENVYILKITFLKDMIRKNGGPPSLFLLILVYIPEKIYDSLLLFTHCASVLLRSILVGVVTVVGVGCGWCSRGTSFSGMSDKTKSCRRNSPDSSAKWKLHAKSKHNKTIRRQSNDNVQGSQHHLELARSLRSQPPLLPHP